MTFPELIPGRSAKDRIIFLTTNDPDCASLGATCHFLDPFRTSVLPAYSYLSASTGLRDAAFQVCRLTANSIMIKIQIPVRAKTHQLIGVL